MEKCKMKVFKVIRIEDETGVSGTGHIINGVVFDNGTVVIRWRTPMWSIAIYNNWEEFKKIHIDSHPSNETIHEIQEVEWLQWSEE